MVFISFKPIPQVILHKLEWGLLIAGSFICIVAFTYKYTGFLLEKFPLIEIFRPAQQLMNYAITFIPQKFPWLIFFTGFVVIISANGLFVNRNVKYLNNN